MPRGVKGSGKAAVKAQKPASEKKATTRKSYPTREERIAMADKQIARLTKLNDSRAVLVAKTEKVLKDRKSALEKSTAALNREIAKKERLTADPKKARQERTDKRNKLKELASKLEASGKTVEDILSAIID